jgi:two-component system, cell cycle sensor histidine kinase and response regulator CckA
MLEEQGTGKKQILVVEDESLIAADLQKRLEKMGYSATAVAHSGEEALGCARKTPFDLVLMDIRLKGPMDGIAAANRLKQELQTPVVYITAHADHETLERAKLTEPCGYVIKPVADASLRSAVQIGLYKGEMERRLRTSEGWLATTLGSIGDGIIACDNSGEIAFMNRVAERLTGWESAAAKGKRLMDVLGLYEESSAQPAKNPVYDLLPGEHRVYSLASRTGAENAVEIGCVENGSQDDPLGSVLVLRDVGPRRELESRLLQSQRMESVAGLAGGLAHDFNNLLMIMMGNADELCTRLTAEEQRLAADIKQSASIASSITQQLLILSRRDAARTEVLNLNEVISEFQPLISHTLGRARTLITDSGSPAAFVSGDRSRLKQMLLNLALNARDAVPAGGELRISTEAIEIGTGTPQSRQYRPGRYARLRVADNGKGMDKETLARIFEPFFTTKSTVEGRGLGLAIVHSIVAQSGGYITATSELGRGTSFEILLPSIGTFQGNLDQLPATGRRTTILLAEDEARVRRLMHGYLEREGFQLLAASSAEEAESIAEAYRHPIDLLVADIVMLGRSGAELAQRMVARQPEIKILFVSGYRHDAMDQFGGPGAEFLLKPFPGSELVRRVRQLLPQPAARIA